MSKIAFSTLILLQLITAVCVASGANIVLATVNSNPEITLDFNSLATPDTSDKITVADTGWAKASQKFAKPEPVKSKSDTTGKPVKKSLGKPTVKPLINPYRPPQLTEGLKYAKEGNLQMAIVYFDSCIVKNPKNYNAYFYKSKALVELNRNADAFTNINLALEYNKNNPVFYYYRGKMYFDSGNTDKAAEDFDKAVSIKKDFADALNYRGVTKELKGKHAEAISDYDSAILANPAYAIAHFNRGTSLAAMGKYDDAITAFSRCIELDPKKSSAFMNRGNCHVMLNKFTEAISDYSHVISLDAKNHDAYFNRGVAKNASGDNTACDDWKQAKMKGSKKASEMLDKYCK